MLRPFSLSLALCLLGSTYLAAPAQDATLEAWTRFRGPNGDGIGHAEQLPESMDVDQHALWRMEFKPGHSSPVVFGERLFLTSFDEQGLYTSAVSPADGQTLWETRIERRNPVRIDGRNNAASPSPAVDADVLVVFFPEQGLYAYDHAGKQLWHTALGPFDNVYGMGASPVLFGGRVFLACDQTNDSYVAAFDKRTGKEEWRSMRPWAKSGHCTPIIIPSADGGHDLILPGSFYLDAYDMQSGERKWWAGGLCFEMKSVPVYYEGLLYTNGYGSPLNQVGNQISIPDFADALLENDANEDGLISQEEMPPSRAANWFSMVDLAGDGSLDAADWGFLQDALASKNGLLAIQPAGKGVRGELPAASTRWSFNRAVPQLPSPLIYADVLYMLQDSGGLLVTLDPSTGEVFERGRLEAAVDTYYASPIAADDKLYICSENGKVVVLPAGGSLEPLSVTNLGERIYATPIVHDNSIILRTEKALYRFGKQQPVVALDAAAKLIPVAGKPKARKSSKDWPAWGGDESRRSFSTSENLPGNFSAGEFIGVSDAIDMSTTENVKWIAKLGTSCYGNPTVADGRVYVGTNNDAPRDARIKGDYSLVYCLEEETGALLWQLSVPKLGTGPVSDWEGLGICSSPTVDGDRVYLVTTRCEVICLDVNGMADGNDGSFQDEAQYMAGPGNEPIPVAASDADILWVIDMIKQCGVAPHNTTTSAVLVADELLWVSTSNGVNYEHSATPAPEAPSLIMVDKLTGTIVAEENSGLSSRMFHSNWSSPAYFRQGDLELCIFGGPDGFCYAFSKETETQTEGSDGIVAIKEAWRFDCNPPEYRTKDGKPIKYTHPKGPSEVLGTPITGDGLIYCLTGQDPDHGEGVGNLVCLTPEGKQVWSYKEIFRSMSMMALGDGRLYAVDYSGFVYCFDAKSGKLHWRHDTKGHIWGSPLLADGKLYVGNEDGYLTILPASSSYDESKVVEVDMTTSLYGSPIAANDVLYIATPMNLYAIAKPKD